MIHNIEEQVKIQREYFFTGATKSVPFRIEALLKLKNAIKDNQKAIFEALKSDLDKPEFESYMTEIGIVLDEISFALKNIKKWTKVKKVKTPFAQFPAKSFRVSEPYGVVLIMAPWNYPFQLALSPLVGAIAAGNCAIIKPSNYSPATSKIIDKIISDSFDSRYIDVVLGGRQENTELLKQKFDYIFFTGGTTIGKLVMESASKNLTPVTLELGGKSPCIVDDTADIDLTAKRIVFGKFLNAGQTCVAPDYVYAHESIKDSLISSMMKYIIKFFGDKPLNSKEYPRIINEKHFNRLLGLIENETLSYGGRSDSDKLKIEPTILPNVNFDSPIMQEEIFGPLLPVLTFESLDEVISNLTPMPKPLALYFFSTNEANQNRIINSLSFGGGCINDTIVHLATHYMPFGGVGNSGIGSYHGVESFNTFSHCKSIMNKSLKMDLPMRYHPYNLRNFALVKRFLK